MFSCSGKLDHFSSQQGIWKILKRFIQSISDNERRLISQDNINTINELAEHPNEETQEIDEEIIGDDIHQNLLQLTERMMHPSREVFKSQEQFAGLLQSLENIRQTVVNRRMQMQQVPEGWETGTSGPLQVQEHIEQQGGHQEWMMENRTMGDPCSSYAAMDFSTGQQNITDPQLLSVKIEPAVSIDVPEVVMDPLPEEYQEQKSVQRLDLSDGGVQTADGQLSASIWWDKIYNAA